MATTGNDEEQPMPYVYFVSYAHTRGFGSITVNRGCLVDSAVEVGRLSDFVKAEVREDLALIGISRLA